MTRLVHTEQGAARSMQISEAVVFAFVEGGLDRPFVDKILNHILNTDSAKHRVQAIKEITNGTGGKPALIAKFREFSEKNLLKKTAWKKTTISIFFLDKDADDYLNKKIESPHVIYTKSYDLEGDLFQAGDLTLAIADTCLLTHEQAKTVIQDKDSWLKSIALNWVDWITLCILSQKESIAIGCTYDRISDINTKESNKLDVDKLAAYQEKMALELNIPKEDFMQKYGVARQAVINSINNGEPLRFLKGKWLKSAIQEQASKPPRIPDSSTQGIGDRILSVLLGHVAQTMHCTCANRYSVFLKNLLPATNLRSA